VTGSLPKPLACDGEATHDPASKSVLVRVSGFGASFWRRGPRPWRRLRRLAATTHRPSTRMRLAVAISRGEAVRDGWLRFQLSDADYRQLTGEGLSAIVTVDHNAGDHSGCQVPQRFACEPVLTNAFSPTLTRAGTTTDADWESI